MNNSESMDKVRRCMVGGGIMDIKQISEKSGTSIGITQRHLAKLQQLNLTKYISKGRYMSKERPLPLEHGRAEQ